MKKAKVVLDFIKNNSDKITMVQININSRIKQYMYENISSGSSVKLNDILLQKIDKLSHHSKIHIMKIIDRMFDEEQKKKPD